MPQQFILIPGRSSRQGVTLNEGKYTEGYIDETSILRMHADDMTALNVAEGDELRMWNEVGEVVVPCMDAGDECPPGLVFICYGDKSSQLMGSETHGSGMPDSKGLDVYLQAASLPRAATDEAAAPVTTEAPSPVTAPSAPKPVPSQIKPRQGVPVRDTDDSPAATSPATNIAMILFIAAMVATAVLLNL